MPQNYTVQVTQLEDASLSIRVSENFYRYDGAEPITNHHKLAITPGQSITPDLLAADVEASRSEWAANMRAGGDHTRMSDIVNAVIGVVHTPEVIAAYRARPQPRP